MPGIRIDEIEVPLSLDGEAAADFVPLIDVQNACAPSTPVVAIGHEGSWRKNL